MKDLTIIYLTVNKMPEPWVQFHRKHLLRAIQDYPMIVVSRTEMDFGRDNVTYLRQKEPFCAWNIYVQILRAARMSETPYIGIAEDDSLYSREHFSGFRPKDDEVAYDMARWSVFAWEKRPVYSMLRKRGNFAMIGSRQLVVDALTERMANYPDAHLHTEVVSKLSGEIGRRDVEKRLGVTRRKAVEFYAQKPIVNLAHGLGLSPTYVGRKGLKRAHGEMRAFDIPHWGKAADIAEVFNSGMEEDK